MAPPGPLAHGDGALDAPGALEGLPDNWALRPPPGWATGRLKKDWRTLPPWRRARLWALALGRGVDAPPER